MPHLNKQDALELVRRRHPEWNEFQRKWRWLADSLEGGNRYRHADYTIDPCAVIGDGHSFAPWYNYGFDPQTSQPYPISYRQICDRNLVPHLREMGTDGRDLYVMRLARTPVPALVERTTECHLAKIYGREVHRTAAALLPRTKLADWWADCDGRGSSIDQWMVEVVGPMLLAIGQLDLCFDHPEAPAGAAIESRADELALGLDACVASIILPENLVWWRLDARGRYAECLVFERCEGVAGYRHWTATDSNFYSAEGEWDRGRSRKHPYKCVPIVRVFDRRIPRTTNCGKSRYESIAELQKAIYNASSELILSDIQQSHAQLCIPEDFLQQDSEISIGPDRAMPMKRVVSGNSVSYQAPQYLDPPKGAQQEVRTHILDWKDEADRDGALSKPAGQASGSTVAQSGISKALDGEDGNAKLARVAEVLANAERAAAAMAYRVLANGKARPADLDAIEVSYPKAFDLFTADDLAKALTDLQMIAQAAGALPELEGELLKRLIAVVLPGLTDERLDALRGEVDDFLTRAAAGGGDDADPAGDESAVDGEAIVESPTSVLLSPTPA